MTFEPLDFVRLMHRRRERKEGGQFPPEFFDHLRGSWEELSFAYARLDPHKQLLPAVDFPGYLMTRCGNWTVFVPWPLVRYFPGNQVLSELIDLGVSITVSPTQHFCISGSAAWLGGQIAISDVDFCQYTDLTPSTIISKAIDFIKPTPSRILTRASYGNQDPIAATPPWEENWRRLERAMTAVNSIDGAERLMMDFVSNPVQLGPIPTSIVILSSDFNDRTRGAAPKSFVYQEAISVHDDLPSCPPWTLVDPEQLAGYLEFLLEEVKEYIDRGPLKALKRALSLALTIRLHDFATQAAEILHSTDAGIYSSANRVVELERQLARFGQMEREVMGAQLQAVLGTALPRGKGVGADSKLPERCQALVSDLLTVLDDLERRAGLESGSSAVGD
jgi:hypothetical protein